MPSRRLVCSALALTLAAVCVHVTPAVAQPSSEQQRQTPPVPSEQEPGGWRGALIDSMRLLMLEHAGRIAFQEKTRRELGGPFFADYRNSLRIPRTWNDGDQWPVNYVGHPVHGAAAGFIWIEHRPDESSLGFSTKAYWKSRGIAAAWIAGYSLQFEFGPLSEASIGNVGLNPATTGWVDHVVTPAGGAGVHRGRGRARSLPDRPFRTLDEEPRPPRDRARGVQSQPIAVEHHTGPHALVPRDAAVAIARQRPSFQTS